MIKKNLLLAGLISTSNLKSQNQNKSFGGALHGGLLIPINNDSIEFLIRAEAASFDRINDIGLYFSAGARYYDDDLSALALLSFPTIARGLKAESKEYLKKIRLTLNGLIELSANIPGLHVGIQGSLAYSGFGIGAALFYKIGRYEIGIDGYYSQKLNESKESKNNTTTKTGDSYKSSGMQQTSTEWIVRLKNDFYDKRHDEINKKYTDEKERKTAKKNFRKQYDPFFQELSFVYLKILYSIYESDNLAGLFNTILKDFKEQIARYDPEKYREVFCKNDPCNKNNVNNPNKYEKELHFRFALKAYNDLILPQDNAENQLNTLLSMQNLAGTNDDLQAEVMANTVQSRILEADVAEILKSPCFLQEIYSKVFHDEFFQSEYPKARKMLLLKRIALQRKRQLALDEYLMKLDNSCNQEAEVNKFIEAHKDLFRSNDNKDYAKTYFNYYLSNKALMDSPEAKWSMDWIIKNQSTNYKKAKKSFSSSGFAKEEVFDFVARKFEKDIYLMIDRLISCGTNINKCELTNLTFNLQTISSKYRPIFEQLKEYIQHMTSNMKNEFKRIFQIEGPFSEYILETQNGGIGIYKNTWTQSYVFYCLKSKLDFEKQCIINENEKSNEAGDDELSNAAQTIFSTIKKEQNTNFFTQDEIKSLLKIKLTNKNKLEKGKMFQTILDKLKEQIGEEDPVLYITERINYIANIEMSIQSLKQQLKNTQQEQEALKRGNKNKNRDLQKEINKLKKLNNELQSRLKLLQTEKETQEQARSNNAQQSKLKLDNANRLLEEEKKKNKELQNDYNALNGKLEESSLEIDKLKEENSKLNGENQGLRLRNSHSEIRITSTNSEANNDQALKDELEKLKEQNAQLTKELEEALERERTKSEELTLQIEQLTVQINEQVQKISDFEQSGQSIKQLQEDIESISKERDEAKAKLKQIADELGINQAKSHELEEEKNKLTKLLEKIIGFITSRISNHHKVRNISEALSEWKNYSTIKLEAERSQNENLEQELVEKNKEIERLQAEIDALREKQKDQLTQDFESQKSNLEAEKAALEDEKNRLQAALDSSLEELRKAQEEAREKIKKLEREKKALEDQLNAHIGNSSNSTDISIQIQTLTTQLTEERFKLELQNQSIEELKKQLADAENEKQRLQKRIEELQGQKETITSLTSRLSSAQTRINQLQGLLDSKNDEERIKQLGTQLDEKTRELDALRDRFNRESNRFNREKQGFEHQINDLTINVNKLTVTIKSLTEEKERVVREKERIVREKEMITREKESTTNQKTSDARKAKEELEKANKERDEAKRKFEEAKRELEEAKRELDEVKSIKIQFQKYRKDNPESLKDDLKTLGEDLEAARQKIQELSELSSNTTERNTIIQLEREIQTLRERVIRETTQTKCDKCKELQEEKDRLIEENRILRAENAELQETIDKLQERIAQLESEKEEKTTEVINIKRAQEQERTPPASAPKKAAPPVSAPKKTTPPRSTPKKTTPPVSAPKKTTPPVSAPKKTTPPVSAPKKTTPPRSTPPKPATSQPAMICKYQEKIKEIFRKHFEKFPFVQQNLKLQDNSSPSQKLSDKDTYTNTVVTFWKNLCTKLAQCYSKAINEKEYRDATNQDKILDELHAQVSFCAAHYYEEKVKHQNETKLHFEKRKQGAAGGGTETIREHIERLVKEIAKQNTTAFIRSKISGLPQSIKNPQPYMFLGFFEKYWTYYNTAATQMKASIESNKPNEPKPRFRR